MHFIIRGVSLLNILAFAPDHYAELERILSAVYTGHTFAAEGLAAQDNGLPDYCLHQRWVGVVADQVIAYGEYRQTAALHEHGAFSLNVAVLPEYQGKGIGSSLYSHVFAELSPLNPNAIRCTARAADAASMAFLERRQYRPMMNIVEWWFDLDAIKPSDIIEKAPTTECNVAIDSVAALECDPERNRKLFSLVTDIRQDVPMSSTLIDYEEFTDGYLGDSSYDSEAAFVATNRSGEYIGYTCMIDDGNDSLYMGLTGVRRDYRRCGVATELKLRSIRYGFENGYSCIKSFCSSQNSAVEALNIRCGFVQVDAWSNFEHNGSMPYVTTCTEQKS